MNTVWVLVNVYQSDLAYVHVGDAVDITTDSYPGSLPRQDFLHRRRRSIPTTRTLQARIVTENPGQKLKKDMYVTATVHAGAIRERAYCS